MKIRNLLTGGLVSIMSFRDYLKANTDKINPSTEIEILQIIQKLYPICDIYKSSLSNNVRVFDVYCDNRITDIIFYQEIEEDGKEGVRCLTHLEYLRECGKDNPNAFGLSLVLD